MSECPPHQPLCRAEPYASHDIAKIPDGEYDMSPCCVESWWCRKCGCLYLVSMEFDGNIEVRRPLVDGEWGSGWRARAAWTTTPSPAVEEEHKEEEVIVGYEERAEVEAETKKICAEAEKIRADAEIIRADAEGDAARITAEVEALKVKAEITRMECEDGHQALAMINQDSVQCREHELSLARLRQRPTLFIICVGGLTILGLALLWGVLA